MELDSLYVMGYVGLADAYALLPSYAAAPKEKGFQMLEELYRDHNTWIIYINCLPDFDTGGLIQFGTVRKTV